MHHIENEIKHCESEMRRTSGEKYSFLYSVRQALEWALDPMSYASPVDTILGDKVGTMDTPADLEDCSAVPHLPLS
jgi:hypothetical protein